MTDTRRSGFAGVALLVFHSSCLWRLILKVSGFIFVFFCFSLYIYIYMYLAKYSRWRFNMVVFLAYNFFVLKHHVFCVLFALALT